MLLIVIDTETGGLTHDTASLTELAAQYVYVDPDHGAEAVGDSFEVRIRPLRPVDPGAAAVNGYDEVEWKLTSIESDEALDLYEQWQKQTLDDLRDVGVNFRPMWTGCNPAFDIRFIRNEYVLNERFFPDSLYHYRSLDVGSLCFPLYLKRQIRNTGLSAMREWAGISGEQAHTALSDVLDTVEVIQTYLARHFS